MGHAGYYGTNLKGEPGSRMDRLGGAELSEWLGHGIFSGLSLAMGILNALWIMYLGVEGSPSNAT